MYISSFVLAARLSTGTLLEIKQTFRFNTIEECRKVNMDAKVLEFKKQFNIKAEIVRQCWNNEIAPPSPDWPEPILIDTGPLRYK